MPCSTTDRAVSHCCLERTDDDDDLQVKWEDKASCSERRPPDWLHLAECIVAYWRGGKGRKLA
jgi:hypothetical protein